MKVYIHSAEDVDKGRLAETSKDPEVLAKLADDEHDYVRMNVAENPNTPPEILAKLSDDDWLKGDVAQNTNTPQEVLAKLAEDEYSYVRRYVARNENTPAEVLAKLAEDVRDDVKEGVAKNPNTPAEIKEKLTQNSKKQKPKRTSWKSIVNQIKSEGEGGIDSLYEQTDAGEYIESLQNQVEDKLGVWLEPSIEGGMGGIWIYSNDDDSTLAENIDYEGFNEDVLDAACNSKNKTEFLKWYKSYLESLIEE